MNQDTTNGKAGRGLGAAHGSTKLRLEIELEYDALMMHGDDADSKRWFMSHILSGHGGDLLLHSNEIGDTLGPVTVLRVLPNVGTQRRAPETGVAGKTNSEKP